MQRYAGMTRPSAYFAHIDWYLFFAALTITLLGLVTMRSFPGEDAFFEKQVIWIVLAVVVFFAASIPEYHFLRRTQVIVALYASIAFLLALLFFLGTVVKGA